MKVELILEGGGMRGAYTCGVLDYFLEKGIHFKNIIAVSAGVANAMYYVSKQKGIGIDIITKFSSDKRYLSFENFIKSGSIFGLDFIFKEIPNKIYPFDYDTFNNSDVELVAVCTNINTGKPHYQVIDRLNDKLDYAIASASLPLVSRVVKVDGLELLDGGVADPIPIKKSCERFDLQVLVLTRNAGYRKNRRRSRRFIAARYPFKSEFKEAIMKRHLVYNESLEFAEALADEGKALIIRPSQTLTTDRFEKDPQKLLGLYHMGYQDAKDRYADLINFCSQCDNFKYKNED